MPLLQLKSIKSKFIVIILSLVLIPLFLSDFFIFYRDIEILKKATKQSAETTLDLVCENLVAPLDFRDINEAERQLKIATNIDYINGIRVYDDLNNLFVKYGAEFSLDNISKTQKVSGDKIYIFREIKFNDRVIGKLVAEVSLSKLNIEIRNYLIFSVLLTFVILILVVIISLKAQQLFLKPIYDLTNIFKRISDTNDYNIRVTKITSDEFGLLYDGINNMLEQILKKDEEKSKILKDLVESEKYNRTLFETIPVGVSVIEFDGKFVDINNEFSNIFEYNTNDIPNLNFWTILNLSNSQKEEVISFIKIKGYIETTELPIYSKSGVPKFVRFGAVITNINENDYILTFFEDITKQKEIELTIKKNQDRYEALIKNTSDVIIVCDGYGNINYISPSFKNNFEVDINDISHSNINEIITKILNYDDTILTLFNKIPSGETQIIQFVYQLPEKKPKYFEALITNLLENNSVNGYILNIRDVTERIVKELEKQKKTKEQIYQSEAKFRVISDNVPDVVAIVDLNYNVLYITQSSLTLFGVSPDDLLNKAIIDLVDDKDKKLFEMQIEQVLNNFEHNTIEYKLIRTGKMNEKFYAEVTMGVIIDDESARIVVTIRDIEQKKLAEEKLKESEERFRFLAETTGDVLYRYRYDVLQYDYLSPAIKVLTGYTFEEINQIGLENITITVEYPEQLEDDAGIQLLNENNTRTVAHYLIRTKDNQEKWIEDHAFLWKENDKIIGTVGILQDITTRKQLEQKLKERNIELERALDDLKKMQSHFIVTEKLASIGQLTAGVAHEINNPLGFVSSNLNRFEEYFFDLYDVYKKWASTKDILVKFEDYKKIVDEIEKFEKIIDVDYIYNDFSHLMQNSKTGIQRIKSIVESLRGFSYLGSASVSIANINQALDETIVMVWNEIKYKAIIEKDYSEIPDIVCNIGELKQVFVNLLINASHAIEQNGIINIKTYDDGKYIYIEIADNGCGIPEENLHKIFDPFFTTKPIGKGSGLGLWISATIISKHNGEISVKSQRGVGTTFTIKLPINV